MGLFITLALGAFVVVGAAIAGFAKNQYHIRELSMSVAFGAIVVLVITDLVPEAFAGADEVGVATMFFSIIVGVALLAACERFLPDSPGHTPGDHAHETALHVSVATTVALSVHNVVEGMSVYLMAFESASMALMLAFGIGIHNIPMGMLVFTGVRNESLFYKAAVLIAACLSTGVGGLIMYATSSNIDEHIIVFMIGLTIGLLLYIIVFELLPHLLSAQNKRLVAIGALVGASIVAIGVAVAAAVE